MNFEKLTAYLDSLGEKGIPGCDVAVWKDHKSVYRHQSGFSDEARTSPMNGSEVYWFYSVSKLFLAVAVFQLKEAGMIGLDDEAGKYLPCLRDMTVRAGEGTVPLREPITVRHLLAMQAGFDYEIDTPAIRACVRETNGRATTRQMVEAIAAGPLNFQPGDHFCYSLSHDVLGAIVEIISGMKLGDYYEKHIFAPLGIKGISFDLTPENRANMAAQFTFDPETFTASSIGRETNKFRLSENFQGAGAGLCGSVAEYMIFADALAHDGVGANGSRILSKASIDEMRVNQQTGARWEDFHRDFNRPGYGYALGVRTMMDTACSKSPVGEFGWDSYAGAWVLADTENRLCAFYAQHVVECHYSYDVIHPTVRDLIYEALEAK